MQKQQGMTLLQLIFIALLVILLGIVCIKITPVYIEYFMMKRSVATLKNSEHQYNVNIVDDSNKIKQYLLKQFYIDGIYSIQDKNIEVTATPQANNTNHVYKVRIFYKAMVPLFYHMGLFFDFDTTQEVTFANVPASH